jgi:radical SAM-linked protein
MKLYFMIGLPTETEEDVDGIIATGERAREIGESLPERRRRARVTCSVSSFVPKPHTPFQWSAMDRAPVLEAKQRRLHRQARRSGVEVKWHDARASLLEGVLSRGDARVAELIEAAYELGARFDSWDEQFRYPLWRAAMERVALDEDRYLGTLPVDGRLPWDHLDPGLEPGFLAREYRRSLAGRLSPPCGKPRGAVHQPVDRAEAEASSKKLVCYHCGIACDLEKIHGDRVRFHGELESLGTVATADEEVPPARYRLVFAKRGEATALSHLDMVRLWPRLLRRADLPVLYSLGYHPHPRLSFTPALPMGMESEGEQVEMHLRVDLPPEAILERLGAVLPEGLEALACYRDEADALSRRLDSLRMRVEFQPGEAGADAPGGSTGVADQGAGLEVACAALLARESIELERLRKGRVTRRDFRPTLLDLRPDPQSGNGARAAVIVELGLQGPALKAAELAALLGGDPESVRARRLGFRLKEAERARA